MKTLLVIVFFISNTYSQVSDHPCSSDKKISLIFLNGVQNSRKDATRSKERIFSIVNRDNNSKLITDQAKEKICYKFAYNQTEGFSDFLEVTQQKLTELGVSEQLSWTLVSRFLFLPAKEFLEYLSTIIPEPLASRVSQVFGDRTTDYIVNAKFEVLSEITSSVDVELKRMPVILVSHSQGNLFANEISTILNNSYPSSSKELKRFANLQVGSAADKIVAADGASFGDYYTAKQDRVIGGLGLIPGFKVLPANFDMDFFQLPEFFTNHGFIEVYTNAEVTGELDGQSENKNMEQIFLEKMSYLGNKINATPFTGNTRTLASVSNVSLSGTPESFFDQVNQIYYMRQLDNFTENKTTYSGVDVVNGGVIKNVDLPLSVRYVEINSLGQFVGILLGSTPAGESTRKVAIMDSQTGEVLKETTVFIEPDISPGPSTISTMMGQSMDEYYIVQPISAPGSSSSPEFNRIYVIDATNAELKRTFDYSNYVSRSLAVNSKGQLFGFGTDTQTREFSTYVADPVSGERTTLFPLNDPLLISYNESTINNRHDRFIQRAYNDRAFEFVTYVVDSISGEPVYLFNSNHNSFQASSLTGNLYAGRPNDSSASYDINHLEREGDSIVPSYNRPSLE